MSLTPSHFRSADSLRAKLVKCRLVSLTLDFDTKAMMSSRMIADVVARCPGLKEVRLVGMVACEDNDLMSPLARLASLTDLSLKSNAEAFAPSFVLAALDRWSSSSSSSSGLTSFECAQMEDVLPLKNRNKDYEFIDLDSVVARLTRNHGRTLKKVKMDFPLRLRPINSMTGISLLHVAERCRRLETLWLNKCVADDTDILALRKLSGLRSLTIDLENGVSIQGVEALLVTNDGRPFFERLKGCDLIVSRHKRSNKVAMRDLTELRSSVGSTVFSFLYEKPFVPERELVERGRKLTVINVDF